MTKNCKRTFRHKVKKEAKFNKLALAGLATVTMGAVALSASSAVYADSETGAQSASILAEEAVDTATSKETADESIAVEEDALAVAAPTAETVPTAENAPVEIVSGIEGGLASKDLAASEVNEEQAAESVPSATEVEVSTSDDSAFLTGKESGQNAVASNGVDDSVKAIVSAPSSVQEAVYTRPVDGRITTGWDGYAGHTGVDYAMPEGVPVKAARDGIVEFAGIDPSGKNLMGWQAGTAILLRHADGMRTGYAHLSRIEPSIAKGVSVLQGQTIGYVGSTGQTDGPHLHFEMIPPGATGPRSGRIDPTPYIANAPYKSDPTPPVNRYNVDQLSATVGQTVSDGDYHIISAIDPDYGVDVAGASAVNGTNVQLYRNASDASQVFTVTYLGGGYYKLSHKPTGKVLDVAAGSQANGTNVQIWDENGSAAQQWILKQSGLSDTFEIISRSGGLNLDISGGKIANDSNVQVYSSNGSEAQKFKFAAVDYDAKRTLVDGVYRIVSALDESLGLDVAGAGSADNTNVQVYPNRSDANQTFEVKYLDNGYYAITAKSSGKRLDAVGNGSYNGTNVVVYSPNDSSAQQWLIRESDKKGSYEIVARQKNMVLDVASGSKEAGTNVQLYIRNGGPAQLWQFIPQEETVQV